MERIENHVVKDSVWKNFEKPSEVTEKLNGPGYLEIGSGNFVPEEDAFEYALEKLLSSTEELKNEFVEWFYSGSWIKEV